MGSQEVYDRLRSEKANPQADVWYGGPDTIFARGVRDGLLAAYRPAWAERSPRRAATPGDLYFGLYRTPAMPVYNSKAVAGGRRAARVGRPARPEVEGQDPDPRSARLGHDARGVGMHPRAVRRARPARPTPGFAWLARLDAQTKEYVFNPDPPVREDRAAGRASSRSGTCPTRCSSASAARRSSTSSRRAARPSSTTPSASSPARRHADARAPFIDSLGSKPMQRLAAEKTYRLPARTDLGDELPAWAREVEAEMVAGEDGLGRSSRRTGRVDGDLGPHDPRQGSHEGDPVRRSVMGPPVRRDTRVLHPVIRRAARSSGSSSSASAACSRPPRSSPAACRLGRDPRACMDMRLLRSSSSSRSRSSSERPRDLFDRLVVAAVARARPRPARPRFRMIGVTGAARGGPDQRRRALPRRALHDALPRGRGPELAPFVVLEVAAANLLGCGQPARKPAEHLSLHARADSRRRSFFARQLPWAAGRRLLLAAAVPLLVPRRGLRRRPPSRLRRGPASSRRPASFCSRPRSLPLRCVHHRSRSSSSLGGAGCSAAASSKPTSRSSPCSRSSSSGSRASNAAASTGPRPGADLRPRPDGLVLSGALLSQFVSNVPAAMLLAPAAAGDRGLPGACSTA